MSSPMTVGLLRVVLHLPESASLKSKRQVVSGLLKRLRQEHHVAAAEIGEPDLWQLVRTGIATVMATAGAPGEGVAPRAPHSRKRRSRSSAPDAVACWSAPPPPAERPWWRSTRSSAPSRRAPR